MSTTPLLVKTTKDAFLDVMLMPGGNLEAVEALYACCQVDVFIQSMTRIRAADAKRRQMLGLVSPPQLMHAEPYTVRDMLTFQRDPFPYPMLRLHRSLQEPAARMFCDVLRFMGLDDGGSGVSGLDEELSPAEKAELLTRVFHVLGREPLLRDEMFLQLQKQTRANDFRASCLKAWELMRYLAVIYPPTVTVATPLVDYFMALASDPKVDPEILAALKLTWKALEHGLECGSRQTIPNEEEVRGLVTGAPMVVPVFLCNDAPENIFYSATTTVQEAVKTLLHKLQVSDPSSFAMYTSRSTRQLAGMGGKQAAAAAAAAAAAGAKPVMPTAVVETTLLPRNAYVSDLLVEYSTAAQIGLTRGNQVICKLMLRKRWFVEEDADVQERQFVRLCYVQLRHDYTCNHYLATVQGAVVLAALQIAAEIGVIPEPETAPEWLSLLRRSLPPVLIGQAAEEEWVAQVAVQYKTLWSLDHESTMREFVRLLLASPHGGSVFFPLKPVEDSAQIFPKRVTVGVNHNGLHFLHSEDFSLVHEAHLRHIAEYAGRPGRVFFSLAIRDQLHAVEFTTTGGDEICELLDRHIAHAVKRASEAQREADKPRRADPAAVRLPQSAAAMVVTRSRYA